MSEITLYKLLCKVQCIYRCVIWKPFFGQFYMKISQMYKSQMYTYVAISVQTSGCICTEGQKGEYNARIMTRVEIQNEES